MKLDDMTVEQMKTQLIANAKTIEKMTREIGELNSEKIQLTVQIELRDEHYQALAEQQNKDKKGGNAK